MANISTDLNTWSQTAASNQPDSGDAATLQADLQALQAAVAIALSGSFRMFISGLTYANNASDATNDIDIAVGSCRDSTNVRNLVLASAITKRLDAAWAVGTNQGGLDTGAIGNSDYYIWLIMRSDTGVVDALFSLSPTAPTMPSNYDYKRLIGWFKRVGGTIVAFETYELPGGGLDFRWDAPTADVSLASTLGNARRTDAVKVPLNFSTLADLTILMYDASTAFQARVMCPDETDAAVTSANANFTSSTTAIEETRQMEVRTSATGTIAARAEFSTVDTYTVRTCGFKWARRNS